MTRTVLELKIAIELYKAHQELTKLDKKYINDGIPLKEHEKQVNVLVNKSKDEVMAHVDSWVG